MDTLTAQTLTRFCTHLRNLCKAAEVLGCTKNRKQTRSASVTLASLPAGLFVEFRGADGSELDIPAAGLDDVPEAIRMACVGLDARRYAIAGTSAARAQDSAEVAKLRASLDAAQSEARQCRSDMETVAKARNEYKETLAKRNDYAMSLENRITQLLAGDPAQADDAQARKVDELTRECAALQRTVDKLRSVQPAQAAQDSAPVTVPPAGSILLTLRNRDDVTVCPGGSRIEFHKHQGTGVGDALKAEGFRYNWAEHKAGRKVWTR